jgi:hypothetical protein
MKLFFVSIALLSISISVHGQSAGTCKGADGFTWPMAHPKCAGQRDRAASQPAPEPVQSNLKWYEGGTLHRKNGRDWRLATERDRLATSADIAAKFFEGQLDSMSEMRVYANEMNTCVSETNDDGIADDMRVAEIAAACAILMGWPAP